MTSEKTVLRIKSSLFGEKESSELRDSEYKLNWKLIIPKREEYTQLLSNIQNISNNDVEVLDHSYLFHPKTNALFNIRTKDTDMLTRIATEVTDGIKNLHNVRDDKPFSIRGLKVRAEEKIRHGESMLR